MKEKLICPILPDCHILNHRSVTLKKKRVGERNRNKEYVYNKQKFNVFIKCDLGGQMSYPPTPSEKVGKLFPGDQESKHFWLCGKQFFQSSTKAATDSNCYSWLYWWPRHSWEDRSHWGIAGLSMGVSPQMLTDEGHSLSWGQEPF